MRISEYERNAIIDAIKSVDPNAQIWLFGSRTDDRKKGGDIDIGILSSKVTVMEEIEMKQKMYDKIGEQKIDLVVSKDGQEAFFKFAVA
ncbi:MAG: nucleotidyltransferase domain-containing protein, partial [Treponema sp.]|nr:nucleotidyltransferase domain-containing protein [Treponema sp.]